MAPSPFVVEWVERLAREWEVCRAPRRALDVAAGRGRHAIAIARAGVDAFAVDLNLDALRDLADAAAAARGRVHVWCADLTQHPLPVEQFDLVVVTRYLQRDLFPALRRAVVPGGVVLYETFTTLQRALGTGPTSPDHLLEPGELRARFDGWSVLAYEETRHPEAVARIATRRPGIIKNLEFGIKNSRSRIQNPL